MEINNSIRRLTQKLNTDNTDSRSSLLKKMKSIDFDEILHRIDIKKANLYKIGWAYLQNHHDIQDVFQITIIRVYENYYQLREEKYFDTWMTAIFINECKRLVKHKKKSSLIYDFEVVDNSYLDHSSIVLTEALKKLDEIHREVIILKYISGYSQEEISDILKTPLGTVKSRLYRGLRILREEIGGEIIEL